MRKRAPTTDEVFSRVRQYAGEHGRNEGLLRGSAGTLTFDAITLRIARFGKPAREQKFTESLVASSYHSEWFAPLFQDFLRAMEEPARRDANLRVAANCLALTRQGYESHRQGGAVLSILPS